MSSRDVGSHPDDGLEKSTLNMLGPWRKIFNSVLVLSPNSLATDGVQQWRKIRERKVSGSCEERFFSLCV